MPCSDSLAAGDSCWCRWIWHGVSRAEGSLVWGASAGPASVRLTQELLWWLCPGLLPGHSPGQLGLQPGGCPAASTASASTAWPVPCAERSLGTHRCQAAAVPTAPWPGAGCWVGMVCLHLPFLLSGRAALQSIPFPALDGCNLHLSCDLGGFSVISLLFSSRSR